MLHDDCQSVLEARNADEFRGVVLRFAKGLGFDLVTALTVLDQPDGHTTFLSVDNTPAGYQSSADNPLRWRRDPVPRHCKTQAVPFVWGRHSYLAQDAIDLWEEQAPYGYVCGIAMATHLPRGRHFFLGVDGDQALPKNPEEVARMTAELSLFTVHAQERRCASSTAPKKQTTARCQNANLKCCAGPWRGTPLNRWATGWALPSALSTCIRAT
jgi:hypothetical protein